MRTENPLSRRWRTTRHPRKPVRQTPSQPGPQRTPLSWMQESLVTALAVAYTSHGGRANCHLRRHPTTHERRVSRHDSRTLGLTDPLHGYLLQIGLGEHPALKRAREEASKLLGVHMRLRPSRPTSWRSSRACRVFGAISRSAPTQVTARLPAPRRQGPHLQDRRRDRQNRPASLAACRCRQQDRASSWTRAQHA
jgi:hypothetical protein